MSYSPEEVGSRLSGWATSHEQLWHSPNPINGLPVAIDLDAGIRPLDQRLKRRIASFVRHAHEPPRGEGNRYPAAAELALVVRALLEQGQRHDAHVLSRTVKDIRLLDLVCRRMSVRRERPLLTVRVDRRLMAYACCICPDPLRFGVTVVWDRDRHLAWHPECSERLQGATLTKLAPV